MLIDGVRVGSATLGQAEFEALSLAQIDRIEVLRGWNARTELLALQKKYCAEACNRFSEPALPS